MQSTELETSNTVLQDRVTELEQQLEHQSDQLTTIETQGLEKIALLTTQLDAANRQVWIPHHIYVLTSSNKVRSLYHTFSPCIW